MALIIDPACDSELPAVLALIERAGLPPDRLPDHLATTLVARHASTIVGSAALELYGDAALLRSVAVDQRLRGQELGQRLEIDVRIGLRQRIALSTGCCSRQAGTR